MMHVHYTTLHNTVVTYTTYLLKYRFLKPLGKYSEAVAELTSSPEHLLTAAQIFLTAGQVDQALAKLEALPKGE